MAGSARVSRPRGGSGVGAGPDRNVGSCASLVGRTASRRTGSQAVPEPLRSARAAARGVLAVARADPGSSRHVVGRCPAGDRPAARHVPRKASVRGPPAARVTTRAFGAIVAGAGAAARANGRDSRRRAPRQAAGGRRCVGGADPARDQPGAALCRAPAAVSCRAADRARTGPLAAGLPGRRSPGSPGGTRRALLDQCELARADRCRRAVERVGLWGRGPRSAVRRGGQAICVRRDHGDRQEPFRPELPRQVLPDHGAGAPRGRRRAIAAVGRSAAAVSRCPLRLGRRLGPARRRRRHRFTVRDRRAGPDWSDPPPSVPVAAGDSGDPTDGRPDRPGDPLAGPTALRGVVSATRIGLARARPRAIAAGLHGGAGGVRLGFARAADRSARHHHGGGAPAADRRRLAGGQLPRPEQCQQSSARCHADDGPRHAFLRGRRGDLGGGRSGCLPARSPAAARFALSVCELPGVAGSLPRFAVLHRRRPGRHAPHLPAVERHGQVLMGL